MVKKIILCSDNSDTAFLASEAALALAKAFEAEVVGVHAYNASMHQGVFRIMEPTLPVQYQKEDILLKQRELHSSLINIGLKRISLSYLQPFEDSFRSAQIKFKSVVKEGKNFQVLQGLLAEEEGDLVVIGSSGFNHNGNGFIGSVCLRVLRNVNRNFLVVKKAINLRNPRFVIGLDGSTSAIAALKMANMLGARFDAELHLIYVFDSKLHKDIFERLKDSLINRETPNQKESLKRVSGVSFSFNSKQQEQIHDQFIDKGLERVGRMILEKAEKDAVFEMGLFTRATKENIDGCGRNGELVIEKKVLEGQIYKRICQYAQEVEAEFIFLGRIGRHFSEGMDIGSVTENVVRFAPCNVFVSRQSEQAGWQL